MAIHLWSRRITRLAIMGPLPPDGGGRIAFTSFRQPF